MQQNLDNELAKLQNADAPTLRAKWQKLYGSDPPKGLSAKLMRRAIGYELQAKAYSGLKPATRRELRKALNNIPIAAQQALGDPTPGSRLIREWHGETHVVDVAEDGFNWNGSAYPSLSAVAREITGTRWNGRKFFGVASQVSPI